MRKTRSKTLPASKRPIATIDFETDPFEYGRIPKPFCAGFYSLETGFLWFWGPKCADELNAYVLSLKTPHIIYAHNGGKFDAYFLLKWLSNPIKVIGSRIAKVTWGIHELRDSYSILPIPLRVFEKDTIDYAKLESEVRETHRDEIVKYLRTDCISLHTLVFKFIERFGLQLTIGGTAIKKLREFHPCDNRQRHHDEKYRKFYFGGRVEALEVGVLKGDWKIYDVNSMYPAVMKNMPHPTGAKYECGFARDIDKNGNIAGFKNAPFYFAVIECDQQGAFPVRSKNAPLDFDVPHGVFEVTSHELKAAIKCGRVQKIIVKEVYVPAETISFGEYVDTYMKEKISSKQAGDKAGEIFAKLLLNSAYGKFGQSPDGYFDYWIGDPDDPDKWELHASGIGQPTIWKKPSERAMYYDVATAASVTGAARAVLMLALAAAKRPAYCDTDSIICESLDLPLSETELGKWKLEATGDLLGIAGKKMYALKSGKKIVKSASKGAVLDGNEVFRLCAGETIHWKNQAPSFSLKQSPRFVDRKIQSSKPKKST